MKATYLVVIPIILKFDSNIGFFLRLLRKSATNTFFSWLWLFVVSWAISSGPLDWFTVLKRNIIAHWGHVYYGHQWAIVLSNLFQPRIIATEIIYRQVFCYMVVVNGAKNIFNWYQYYCSNVWSLNDKWVILHQKSSCNRL